MDNHTCNYDYSDFSVIEMEEEELYHFIIDFVKQTKVHFEQIHPLYLTLPEIEKAIELGDLVLQEDDKLYQWLLRSGVLD